MDAIENYIFMFRLCGQHPSLFLFPQNPFLFKFCVRKISLKQLEKYFQGMNNSSKTEDYILIEKCWNESEAHFDFLHKIFSSQYYSSNKTIL